MTQEPKTSAHRKSPRHGAEPSAAADRHAAPRLPDTREVLRLARSEVLGQEMAQRLF